MRELSDDQILYHLKNNTIHRNKQLSILIKLLNSLNESTALAIDGAWGSGKTVFVKQLCILADSSIEDYGRNNLDETEIEKLREDQKVFYFNAWENDYIDDALSAILLRLIAEENEVLSFAAIKRATQTVKLSAGIKKISHDFIDIDASTHKEQLVSNIKERVERHDAVNEFIDNYRGESKRLVFVIDELDRCKPSFAVDLLETVKHYFARADVTFIFTTNALELSHTVKKYYGNDFDGAGYLNKLLDFAYHLNPVDTDTYVRATLDWSFNGGMVSGTASDAINFFGFQMRQINSYIAALKLVEGYINNTRTFGSDTMDDAFVKGLLIPFALSLKVKNDGSFPEFINGTESGARILRAFVEATSEMKDFAGRLDLHNVSITSSDAEYEKLHIDEFVNKYRGMFERESRENRIGRHLKPFQEAVSLLSAYTTISESLED